MLKKLILKNAGGKSYDLLDTSSVCIADVDGFGFNEEIDYMRIGTVFKPIGRYNKQKNMSGTLFFNGEEPYRDYFAFSQFLRNTPLTLTYETFSLFNIELDATDLSKAELTEDGQVMSVLKLSGRSLWYRTIERYIEPVDDSVERVYPYTWPEAYPAEQKNYVLMDSDSDEESPTKITIYGPAVNPVWRQYAGGQMIATGSYAGTIEDGHRLVIDSTRMPYSIIEYDSNGAVVADRYQLCDFSTERFMYLRSGRNRIAVSHSGQNNLALRVEARIEYASV